MVARSPLYLTTNSACRNVVLTVSDVLLTMMLIQKQPQFNLSAPHFPLHRRHPSAPPAVLVQPTRTPGLLSLSKPVQRVQQPQQRAKQSPKPRQAAAARRSPQLSQTVAATQQQLKPSPEISDKKQPSPAHTPERRGRQSVEPNVDSRPARYGLRCVNGTFAHFCPTGASLIRPFAADVTIPANPLPRSRIPPRRQRPLPLLLAS